MTRSRTASRLTTFATSTAFFLACMDVLVANVALPTIAKELGGSLAQQQWMLDSYTLLFAALLLLSGNLSDRFGAKRIFLIGTALFGLSSLFCALSTSMAMLIAGRAGLGVAAALILPASMAVIKEANPDPRQRANAIGIWSGGGAVATAFGPLVGGLLTPIHWSLVFAVNIPFCIAILLVARQIPSSPVGQAKFDWPGQVLSLVGLTALVDSVIRAGEAGFGDTMVLGCAAVAVAALVGFVLHQARTDHPMMPLQIFRHADFNAALMIATMQICTWYGIVYVVTVYLQKGLGLSPFQCGLAFIPGALISLCCNLLSASVIRRFGTWRVVAFSTSVGLILAQFIPSLWVAAFGAGTVGGIALAATVAVSGVGGSFTTPALTGVVLYTFDRQFSGIAAGVFNTFRQIGGALGVAVFGVALDKAPDLQTGVPDVLAIGGVLLMAAVGAAHATRFLSAQKHRRAAR